MQAISYCLLKFISSGLFCKFIRLLYALNLTMCYIFPAIFDRLGRYVITGSDDRLVKIWSMETAYCLASCRGHEVSSTEVQITSSILNQVSYSMQLLYIASYVSIGWHYRPCCELQQCPSCFCFKWLHNPSCKISFLNHTFEFGRNFILVNWQLVLRQWRLADGLPISVLRGHTGAVTAIAFSPRLGSVYQLLS